MGHGEGRGRRTRGRRMCEVSGFCVGAFMCWGRWVYWKGRQRCRKWLEIADAL